MADFCRQCSLETFGKDSQELANLSMPEDTAKNMYPVVLCEGCGSIQVNHLGACVSQDCLEMGHPDTYLKPIPRPHDHP
jgi:hypothetical protein